MLHILLIFFVEVLKTEVLKMQVEVIVLLDWKRSASWGNVKTTLGYQQDKNKINNEAEYYYPWYHKYSTRTTAPQTSSVITWATRFSH